MEPVEGTVAEQSSLSLTGHKVYISSHFSLQLCFWHILHISQLIQILILILNGLIPSQLTFQS